MKITSLSAQVHNPDRVNVSIDGTYRLSLTVSQIIDFGIKVGSELDDHVLKTLELESEFGKLYQRSLEYALVRPRSEREMRDYLYKKTRQQPVRNQKTGEVRMRDGVSVHVTDKVFMALREKGYISDEKFADFWVRYRFVKKGVSERKLRAELMAKGVSSVIIDEVLQASDRDDNSELRKMIEKKRHRYSDETKLMQYLARQGFRYDDIKEALKSEL